MDSIPLNPRFEVLLGCKMVRLLTVAAGVGQHEVVAQVSRVSRPGNEMVHFHLTTEILLQ